MELECELVKHASLELDKLTDLVVILSSFRAEGDDRVGDQCGGIGGNELKQGGGPSITQFGKEPVRAVGGDLEISSESGALRTRLAVGGIGGVSRGSGTARLRRAGRV